MGIHTFSRNILTQFPFDCHDKEGTTDGGIDCLKETSKVRDLALPLSESLMYAMYKMYKEIIVTDEAKITDSTFRPMVCYYAYLDGEGKEIVSSIVQELSEGDPTTRDQKVKMYIWESCLRLQCHC